MNGFDILKERGFVNQTTDEAGIAALFNSNRVITTYTGFDLTAKSLHVGSLIQIMLIRWLEKLGHSPLVLLGEATTRIGDPTGKSSARPILTEHAISENKGGIAQVFGRLLVSPPKFVSNGDWLNDQTGLFDYLTEFGSMFTINRMLGFDSVKNRLAAQEPMSFLEFNYILFQAIDFLRLAETRDVAIQIGGSDQWGNIVNGVELVRRKAGKTVFGLTTPLMTNMAGEKMGKTVNGAVWLDPELTSPFDFWQFWRNVEDGKVQEFLGLFTELSMHEVRRLGGLQGSEINDAKIVLANEVTALVHGHDAAQAAASAAGALSGGDLPNTAPEFVISENTAKQTTIAELLVMTGIVSSKGDAKRLARQNGIKLDGATITDTQVNAVANQTSFHLSVGKKKIVKVIIK